MKLLHQHLNDLKRVKKYKSSEELEKKRDSISPKFFILILQEIFRVLNLEDMGIKINERCPNNLRLVVYILLFAFCCSHS